MTAITDNTVYLHIANVIGRQLPEAEISPMVGGAWIQYRDRWVHVEADYAPGERHLHNLDWTIERGFEAGADMFGGEQFHEARFNVRGFKYGVVPKVIQWISSGTSYNFH